MSTYAYGAGQPVSTTDPNGLLVAPGPGATGVVANAIRAALTRAGVTVAIGFGPETPSQTRRG